VRNSSCILRDDKTFQKKARILTVGRLEMKMPASQLVSLVTDSLLPGERPGLSIA